jgi:Family of unknown function (DUF5995)
MVDMEQARRARASQRFMGSLSGVVLAPINVDEALTALDTVSRRLQADGDALAAFPDIYGIITRKVAEQVARPDGMFLEPAWISRLAGRFCERYLETLRWSIERRPQDCDAWDATYACASMRCTLPVQHVVLGLSAHINFDLTLGIYETICEFGHADSASQLARYKHDHDAVNDLLLASIPEAFAHLAERHGCALSAAIYAHAYAPAKWVTMMMLTRFRATVWNNVIALLAAKSDAERSQVIAKMARRSGRWGFLLKLPSAILSRLLEAPAPTARPAPVIPIGEPVKVRRSAQDVRAPGSRQAAQSRAVRPARFATTAASSVGSIGFGRWDVYPARSARVRS